MKTYLFFSVLVLVLFFSACNKDDDNPGGKTKLLDYYNSTSFPDTTRFDYDASKRLIQTDDGGSLRTIQLNGNQLHYIDFRTSENREVANATYTLNAEGNVISGQGSFSYNIGGSYTSNFTFLYDGTGNLITKTDTRSNGESRRYEYTWTNGDMTKLKWIFADTLYFTQFFEYDTNLDDKIKIDWYKFATATNSFFGNSNQHLRNHTYDIFAPGSTIVHENEFTYTFDSEGYPVTSTGTGITNPGTETTSYHYQ